MSAPDRAFDRPSKLWFPSGWASRQRGTPIIEWSLSLPVGRQIAIVYLKDTTGRWCWRLTRATHCVNDNRDPAFATAKAASEDCERAVAALATQSLCRLTAVGGRRLHAGSWDGIPETEGWYLLRRNRDGAARLAHWCRRTWRVSDSIGRTTVISEQDVAQRFVLERKVGAP